MDRLLTYATTALLPFLWTTSSLAQPADDLNRWGHMMSWGWGHMMFGGVMMIVFWGGIILLIVLLVRSFGGGKLGGLSAPPRATPLDILKERFAKGEIDKKEYDARRKALSD